MDNTENTAPETALEAPVQPAAEPTPKTKRMKAPRAIVRYPMARCRPRPTATSGAVNVALMRSTPSWPVAPLGR